MTPVSITQTGVGRSPIVALDNFNEYFNVAVYATITGTATFNVEISPQDTMDGPITVWEPASTTLTGIAANGVYNFTVPARALSLNVTASTGSVQAYILQSGER